MIADLESLEKRYDQVQKKAKTGEKEYVVREAVMRPVIEALKAGKPARTAAPAPTEKDACKEYKMLQLLTAKPVLYVCNVDEDSAAAGNKFSDMVMTKAAAEGAGAVIISAEIESEVAQLESEEEKKEFLASLGLEETGLAKIIRAGYKLLGLETYFTAGPKEVRAWTFLKGSKAPVSFTPILNAVLFVRKRFHTMTLSNTVPNRPVKMPVKCVRKAKIML